MTRNEALETIFSSPEFRELMESLEEAKKQLSPDGWQEVSQAVINDVAEFVTQRVAELSEEKAGKTFPA
jgi:hypothetical protein